MKFEYWDQLTDILRDELGSNAISRWFDHVIDVERQQNTLYFKVYSPMQADWMENNYSEAIKNAVMRITGEDMLITFVNEQTIQEASSVNESFAPRQQQPPMPAGFGSSAMKFNPRYTFETYVVGSGNRFAHAASMAVAERPAQTYNPLFLYGNSGLGKTHLMHAIGHRVRRNRPYVNIVYTSTETFTNEFIASLANKSQQQFHNRYRNVDILMIDDIQFLSGKEGIQEAFFHTFNALFEKNKQIVISSDRPPKEISTLEERLRSRFEAGLIVDIQPPDLETRMAILQYKAEQDNINITSESIEFIASNIPSNIRELEGALNRVKYYASLVNNGMVNLALCNEVLQGLITGNKKQALSSDLIKKTVAEYYHLKATDLESKRRDQSITHPRHIAMYLCQSMLNMSLSDIGKEFGGRDHTTVLHGCKKIQAGLEKDYNLEKSINEIKEIISR
ncbi:MAG: chromosomal replication initiator protein DnaA [Bacillota bacterium]|jgi:chromosomal replication initiator protein